MVQGTPVEMVRHASLVSILWGVLLIVLGMVAVGSPFLAAVAVNVVVGWLIVLAGVVHLVLAFRVHGAGSVIWKALVGVAYLCFGTYVILHPVLGVASLTLILASLFLIEGVLDIVLFVKMRPIHGSSWVLIDGIVTLLLGLLIYMQWPSSSAWAIGTLVGISLIFSGVARVGMSMAVRKATGVISPPSSSVAA
ncbi:MAG: HdeD family acid-resistance protein [Candidatus Sulfotelmatobacter sp.]